MTILLLTFFALTLTMASGCINTMWGEGYATSMDGMGAVDSFLSAKIHGMEPKAVYGPSYAKPIAKRSYRRAQRRAELHGYTWYRGKLFTNPMTSTCSSQQQISQASPGPQLDPPKRVMRKRLLAMTWNAGGLAPATWDLFQQWLDGQNIDFVAIQETHWPSYAPVPVA